VIEQDVIGHLIDVERLAYDLLLEAQTEADKRKAAAKEAAGQEYRSSCERILTALEESFTEERRKCDESRMREYERYDTLLESTVKDRTSFDAYLDSVCSGQ